jgi:hypothetical protein
MKMLACWQAYRSRAFQQLLRTLTLQYERLRYTLQRAA